MSRFGVIGQPVAHSASPRIHAAFGEQLGIALDYERIEVDPDALSERLSELHAQGFTGLNVTLPHKQAVSELCARRSARARLAEAVNTLSRIDAGWAGDNTDGEGLLRDLRENLGVTLAGERVLVLGAGGAARGILPSLLESGPAELVLSNRSPWKPEAIAEALAAHGPVRPATHMALKGDRFGLVINAMSVGHRGSFPRLPEGLLAPGAVAYDLSYGAAHAPFAHWAHGAGAASVHDGLGMLVEQAAASFAIWHGRRPETAPVIAMLRAG